jgi:DNA-directed RNA polymerase subunit L
MELRAIESEEDELAIEIGGEDHTFMNVLKSTLLEIEDVTAATYDMNPEQSGGQTDPVLTVKTDGRDPLDAIDAAADRIEDEAAAFRDEFESAA